MARKASTGDGAPERLETDRLVLRKPTRADADAIFSRYAKLRARAGMTADGFRRLALRLPEAAEVGHMGHPDFRLRGKIFATLGYPNESWAVLKLTPEQQDAFVDAEPEVFVPVKGGWGRAGATQVRLRPAKPKSVRTALAVAWENVAPRSLLKKPAARKDRS